MILRIIPNLWIRLWITLLALVPGGLYFPSLAFGWGDYGHRIIAEYAMELAHPDVVKNCKISAGQLIDHVNDPDSVWRTQRYKHPNEAPAHYFDLNKQPKNWKSRTKAADIKEGYLVYRILDWVKEAKTFRQKKEYDKLHEHLYGLAHYLGDLTQPLHLHEDYDGKLIGLPGLHSQFETKMLNRFRDKVRIGIQKRLRKEKIPAHFKAIEYKTLIFSIAEQSNSKVERLFRSAKSALIFPSKKNKAKKNSSPRFVKTKLWDGTGELALDQLALASRLVAHTLTQICQ